MVGEGKTDERERSENTIVIKTELDIVHCISFTPTLQISFLRPSKRRDLAVSPLTVPGRDGHTPPRQAAGRTPVRRTAADGGALANPLVPQPAERSGVPRRVGVT